MNLYQYVCENYGKPKQILFNTEMVQATLEGRKGQTRRPIDVDISNNFDIDTDGTIYGYQCPETGDIYDLSEMINHIAPYQPGDILYVRETWAKLNDERHIHYEYKADSGGPYPGEWPPEEAKGNPDAPKWKPSIHMPKEVSRIFLKVTDVRAERLQDITQSSALAEGVEETEIYNELLEKCSAIGAGTGHIPVQAFAELWDSIYAKPKPVIKDGGIDYYISYPWEDITETREHKGKKWHIYGSPWAWVIEFRANYYLENLKMDI